MKPKLVGILTVALLVCLVGFAVWMSSGPREPVYEGRPLRSWLDHHVASSAASPPYGSPGWKKADEALQKIGTNGIPTLVRMLRAKDKPAIIVKGVEIARKFGVTKFRYRSAIMSHEEAEYAFETLGTNGISAVPELIRIYEKTFRLHPRDALQWPWRILVKVLRQRCPL